MAKLEFIGKIWSEPKKVTTDKSTFTSLTIIENNNFFDKTNKKWVDQEPNFFNVLCFNKISETAGSLKQGDDVLIRAILSVKRKSENETYKYSNSIICKSLLKLEKSNKKNEHDQIPDFDSGEEINFPSTNQG